MRGGMRRCPIGMYEPHHGNVELPITAPLCGIWAPWDSPAVLRVCWQDRAMPPSCLQPCLWHLGPLCCLPCPGPLGHSSSCLQTARPSWPRFPVWQLPQWVGTRQHQAPGLGCPQGSAHCARCVRPRGGSTQHSSLGLSSPSPQWNRTSPGHSQAAAHQGAGSTCIPSLWPGESQAWGAWVTIPGDMLGTVVGDNTPGTSLPAPPPSHSMAAATG